MRLQYHIFTLFLFVIMVCGGAPKEINAHGILEANKEPLLNPAYSYTWVIIFYLLCFCFALLSELERKGKLDPYKRFLKKRLRRRKIVVKIEQVNLIGVPNTSSFHDQVYKAVKFMWRRLFGKT